jgi:hypothetical protein
MAAKRRSGRVTKQEVKYFKEESSDEEEEEVKITTENNNKKLFNWTGCWSARTSSSHQFLICLSCSIFDICIAQNNYLCTYDLFIYLFIYITKCISELAISETYQRTTYWYLYCTNLLFSVKQSKYQIKIFRYIFTQNLAVITLLPLPIRRTPR